MKKVYIRYIIPCKLLKCINFGVIFVLLENVIQRQKEVQVLWQNVKNKALNRRSRLESAVGQQIFMNSSKNLLNWLSSIKELVNTDNSARDVVTAENLLKNHQVI